MPTEQVPQLRLGFTRFDDVPEPTLPDGYGLRTFRPGDEDAWIAILNTADFGVWDRARLGRMLSGDRAPMPYEGIFFATKDDRPVGVACTFFYRDVDPSAAEIGWVAVLPEHQGQRLARTICAAALCFIQDRAYKYAFLKTEHYRTAAIKTYLALGFQPEIVDPAQVAWWAEFLRSL